jgi:hypothetical protein
VILRIATDRSRQSDELAVRGMQDIERCKKEHRMWETAQTLVDMAIRSHMQMHGVDHETARYWIGGAMDVV